MEEYIKVEVSEYVKKGLENGRMKPKIAEKFSKITARQGEVGETIISWSEDELGQEVKKKKL